MVANFKEIQCKFCGRVIRNTDKFCIFCGSKIEQSPPKAQFTQEEQDEVDKELGTGAIKDQNNKRDTTNSKTPFLVTEGSQDELDERILSVENIEKEKKNKKSIKEEKSDEVELPEEIKDQLETKMKLAIVENKKTKLKEKLKKLTNNLDSEKYEYDMEYAQNMNMKLNAFKSIKEELTNEENELREELGPNGQFKLDELDHEMEVMREQLIELKRTYKLHKIKRDIYEQLKLEYSTSFRQAEDEAQSLRVNIIRWLSKEKTAKNKIEGRIRLLQARLKTHEIDNEEFESQKSTLEKDLEQTTQKIKILEIYSHPKKSNWF